MKTVTALATAVRPVVAATSLLAAAFLLTAVSARAASDSPQPDELLAQTRAAYAALNTYADSGVVVVEYKPPGAPALIERHAFTTRFRAPRQFYFDFRKDSSAGGERFVIWCPGDDFNSWWSTTGVHETYPKGEGATAFAVGALPTAGSVLLIPPLLFQPAKLQGPVIDMTGSRYVGVEDVVGRRSHKLTADVRLNHWSETTRPTTVWIDAETLLIHKVLEDAPSGVGAGTLDRVTTTFDPKPNPKLDDAQFCFAPPK